MNLPSDVEKGLSSVSDEELRSPISPASMETSSSTSSTVTARKAPQSIRSPEKIGAGKIRTTSLRPSKPHLLSYDEIPAWYQDNEHIKNGYRPESFSAKACFASWAYIHNETFNIYSHLIPAVVFLLCQPLLHVQMEVHFPRASVKEHIIVAFFLATATLTLSLSFTYHTLMNHSMRISHLWLRMDFVGIVLLTLGDFISGIYLVFYCENTLQYVYWAMIATLGLTTSFLVVHPRLQGLKYRSVRVAAFVATGLSGFAPLIHGLVIHGWDHMWAASGMPYYLLEGLLLCTGAVFYSTRCPESVRPGKFDIWGCSHNIFHVLVVAATVVQAVGIWEALKWQHSFGECQA